MRNRALTWAGLLLGFAGLVLQFTISMPSRFRLPLARAIEAIAVTTSPAALALIVIAADKFLARTSRTARQ